MAVTTGHQFPEKEFYVDPVRVEEFVLALGIEPQPEYRAELGAPVPPGFLVYVTTYGAGSVHEALDLDLLRTVFGGVDEEFLAPVRIGDRLTVRPHVSGITEKSGSRGRLTFVDITTEYLLADGAVAVRERSTVVQRG
jgi:acyl dehydratase